MSETPQERAQALEAEVERLRAEMKHNDPASYSSMVQWREKCYEARAEVERLRGALERISDLTHTDDCRCQAAPVEECGCQPSMREMARAALRGAGISRSARFVERAK